MTQLSLPRSSSTRSTWVFLGAAAATLLAGVFLLWVMLRPPASDLIDLTRFLAVSTAVSLLVGLAAGRLGLWQQPRLRFSLTLGSLLAGGLTFFNVWLTARFMFINQQHDLALAEVLLIFSSLLMIAFASLASTPVIENAVRLAAAAGRVRAGDFSARVQAVGRDELARTAEAFNAMAAELENTAEKQRELEQLRRDLIAWTSHDLRTPLTSIRVRVEALADGVVSDPETVSRYHAHIKHEVERLTDLMDELFELAQLDAGGPAFDLAPYSLGDLVSDTLESFRLQAEAQNVALSGQIGAGLDPVRMDAQKISRLLSNLLANALRHTPPGGAVTLRAAREGEAVTLEVKDTGEGIPPADLPRVFERFFRGERSRTRLGPGASGAGLGLAIARSIAEGHRGTIEAQSEAGKGARFVVRWEG